MEDNLNELIPPDVLASHAYWDNFRRKATLYPEQSLMLAVLEDAIRSIQNQPRTSRSKVRREAIEWVLEQRSDYVFSFENICAALGFDAGYLRKGILMWQGHDRARVRPPGADGIKKISRGSRMPQPSL
jgi:hypothetical protein